MPPNFVDILTQAEIINMQGSALLVAIREFLAARMIGGVALSASQKTGLKTEAIAALTAVEAAAAAIRAELAS